MKALQRAGQCLDTSFFVLRTPLLPFDTLARLGDGLRPAAAERDAGDLATALSHDRALLRTRLRDLVRTPAIREAIFVASPDLDTAVDEWLIDPDSPRVASVERSLIRYLTRMAARPTPFGLFAATQLGAIGDRTSLSVAPAGDCRRRSRLDMDFLTRLADGLAGLGDLAAALRYQPNSSLHRAAGRWRYLESRLADKARTHHLVAIDDDAALTATLTHAGSGSTRSELAAALADGTVTRADAEAYVGDLIACQVLVSDLECPVTGGDPLHHLRSMCERHGLAEPARTLAAVDGELETLDRAGTGGDPARYRAIATHLAPLPAAVDMARLFQVDLVRPSAGATLGVEVVDEIRRGVDVLRRLMPWQPRDELAAFRDAFVDRYEGRAVPLLDALDEDGGVGAALTGGGRDSSPLVHGLEIPPSPVESIGWGPRETGLLRRVGEALAAGRHEVVLTAADVDALAAPDPLPLPSAFAAVATVAAADDAACASGDFRVCLHGASGPSGADLLGRFCHADPDLAAAVGEHIRSEQALDPEAVFAEIVHLPEGRLGNILLRPLLRDYEIPCLGRSGAPVDRQIPPGDLTLAVEGGRFVLRSTRLGRRVVPRLTTAHNFRAGSVGVYRLLCLLQADGCQSGVSWSWGPLAALPFLPRVTCGRIVLARATWHLMTEDVRAITAARGAAGFAHVQAWRAALRLPRWIVVADGDNTLPVDLDNALAVESFVRLISGRDHVFLTELLPEPDQLCARGPDGRFVHEVIVPFVTPRPEAPRPASHASASAGSATACRRTFAPGSEWIYAKLYGGAGTADHVLRDAVGPVSRALLASGRADRWFFIRYADPDPHLRWRVHAAGPKRIAAIRARIEKAAAALMRDGLVRRLTFDTYEREIERYGGPDGMATAEQLFWIDSDTAVEALRALGEHDGAGGDARWQLAVAGADALVVDLGLSAEDRLALFDDLRQRFGREFRVDPATRRQLATKYRSARAGLERLRQQPAAVGGALGAGLAVLAMRTGLQRAAIAELRAQSARGGLTATVPELAASYVHMHINRVLRADHRLHELVIYDFLAQDYRQRLARAAGGPLAGTMPGPAGRAVATAG